MEEVLENITEKSLKNQASGFQNLQSLAFLDLDVSISAFV